MTMLRSQLSPHARRRAAAGLLAAAVLGAHVAPWLGPGAPVQTALPAAAPALQLRLMTQPAPRSPAIKPAAPAPVAPAALVHAAPRVKPTTAVPAALPAPAWPVYAADPPPPAERLYLLQRGNERALARLIWAPQGGAYSLSLMGETPSAQAAEGGIHALDGLGAASTGSVAAAGLLPQRHVERRRGRDVRATNIDAAAGWVRGSGGGTAHPWPAAGQDRLSWLLQLAAVLRADTALAQPGAQVRLAVAGHRGPVAAWVFEVRGLESVELAEGQQATGLALSRAPQFPYDLHIDVWLDPAEHFLPLRLRLAAPPSAWESLWLLQPAKP